MLTVSEIDEELETIRQRISSLEKDKRLYVQKAQGVANLRPELDSLLEKYALSEREFLTVISDKVVNFVKSGEPRTGEAGPRYWTELASYFESARQIKKQPKAARNSSSAQADEDKIVLKAGRYLNPHTGLYLNKIRRPTREFQEWIHEYGAETVSTWRLD